MSVLKVSLITICYNSVATIQKCIDSVAKQTYGAVEYIVIDGNSVDGTQDVILKNQLHINYFNSEPDAGIYDAMNKGLSQATGDVIGMLNADDYFSDENALMEVMRSFVQHDPDILYADLDYVDQGGSVTRKWRSGNYTRKKFNWGWMPPHPTFYVKKSLFNELGQYRLDCGTAADYELMLRFMYLNRKKVFYLNKVIVKMRTGGQSNQNFRNRLNAWKHDYNAMVCHRISLPVLGIVLKPLRKVFQFIS